MDGGLNNHRNFSTRSLFCFRLADHFGGKLHMGFIKIRDRLKELEVGDYSMQYFMNIIEICVAGRAVGFPKQ